MSAARRLRPYTYPTAHRRSVDDALWVLELAKWAHEFADAERRSLSSRRTGRHAPLTIGSTTTETPLIVRLLGIPERYYEVTYDAPGAPDLGRAASRR